MLGSTGTAGTLRILPAVHNNVVEEAGATLHETRSRAARRLLEAALKVLGMALLLIACAMFVYLGAALFARGADWILIP